jgi:CelD/BcsL family acetyltransferase involved in cellulose biosynthesis
MIAASGGDTTPGRSGVAASPTRSSVLEPGPTDLARQLTVQRITDPSRLAELAVIWDSLIDEQSCGAIFRSPSWLLPWWHCLGQGKQLCMYVASLGGEVHGVLPAYHIRTALGGQRLRLMGDGLAASDYLGLAALPRHEEAVAAAIARTVLEHERDVVLEGLLQDDPLVVAFERAAGRAGLTCSTTPMEPCPWLSLAESGTFSDWLQRRHTSSGAHLRRQQRRLQKRPGYRAEVLSLERDIVEALPTLWRLHSQRWATQGGSEAVFNSSLERFQHESVRALARRGWARLYVIHIEGEPRAVLYGFGRGKRFAYYQSGWDPAWRQWSLGAAVLRLALEDTCARGLAEFDFLRGDEAYKWLFASSSRQLVSLRLASGAAARALWAGDVAQLAARRLGRGVLPARLLEWSLQRHRRLRQWAANKQAS